MTAPFADRLVHAMAATGPLCVGLDPHPGQIPALFGGDTAEGVLAWGKALITEIQGKAAVIKPQAGLFERHGWQGMKALAELCADAQDAGLIVLMDAKRGDIGSTAQGYADAYLAANAPFRCDALTVNPYMGLDTLEPHIMAAEASGKGVIVLARTSNPGAADFQESLIDGQPLYHRIVEALAPLSHRLKGLSGWSGLMLVVGATAPYEARSIRQLAPDCLFLVPGYGAQGASAQDATSGFVNGEGGCVSASRSVTMPRSAQSARTMEEWRTSISAAITMAQTELRAAAMYA